MKANNFFADFSFYPPPQFQLELPMPPAIHKMYKLSQDSDAIMADALCDMTFENEIEAMMGFENFGCFGNWRLLE